MKLNKYAAIAALLVTICSSHAAVTQMEEFYNPGTNQTVVLVNDQHLCLPETDAKAHQSLVQLISNLQAPLITEDYPLEMLSTEIKENLEVRNIMLITMLSDACRKQQVAVHGIEFRRSFAALEGLFLCFNTNIKTYKEIIATSNEPKTMKVMYNLFDQSWQQAHELFEDTIIPYVKSLEKNKEDFPYIDAFDELLTEFSEAKNVIIESMQKLDEQPIAEYMASFFEDVYIEEEDGSFVYNIKSLWRLTEDAMCKLFDAHILKKLHELKKERVVFVHTGSIHLSDLASKYLPSMGFESKSKISHQQGIADLFRQKSELHQNIGDIVKSKDFESHCVNVDAFIKQCKTLPITLSSYD